MLKINRVYLYNDSDYIYVHDKKRFKKRIIYTVSSVNSRGRLLHKRQMRFQRNKFVEEKSFKVELIIRVPKPARDKILFDSLISRANKAIDLAIQTKNPKDLLQVGCFAHACIGLVNKKTKQFYTLRDFARAVKIKSYSKTYSIVAAYLSSVYTPKKYVTAIPNAADVTIVSILDNYTAKWKCLYGYSKKIDAILIKDLTEYQREAVERGLHRKE